MINALRRHLQLLTLVLGSTIVTVWTIFRHISNGVNFDVVGQIGLADQWLHGMHDGAQLGATNYLLKIPLYMVMNAMDFISPMNRLLLLALLCNITTFLLIFVLFKKILRVYGVESNAWLYVVMLWLASIMGNIFWVDYANSRNLETVGGLLIIYLMLQFIKSPSYRRAACLIPIGSLVFFADSLQLYVCGTGICLYAVILWLRHRTRDTAGQTLSVIGLTAAAAIGAQLLRTLAERLLHVSFLSAPKESLPLNELSLLHLPLTLIHSTLAIFGADFFEGARNANSAREFLNFIILLSFLTLVVLRLKRSPRQPMLLLVGCIALANYLVYVASGQVFTADTERYLIMLPLFIGIASSIVLPSTKHITHGIQKHARSMIMLSIALSSLALVVGPLQAAPTRHSKDTHIYTTITALQDRHIRYALSSRETGITTSYFAQGSSLIVPMLCDGTGRLFFSDLFYDQAPLRRLMKQPEPVAILVPEAGIGTGPYVCGIDAITAQFGNPIRVEQPAGIGSFVFYTPDQITRGLK